MTKTVDYSAGRASVFATNGAVCAIDVDGATSSAPATPMPYRKAQHFTGSAIRVDGIAGRSTVIGSFKSATIDLSESDYGLLRGSVRKHLYGGGSEYVRAGVRDHGAAMPDVMAYDDAISEAYLILSRWLTGYGYEWDETANDYVRVPVTMADSLRERHAAIVAREGSAAGMRFLIGSAARDGVRRITKAHAASTLAKATSAHRDAMTSHVWDDDANDYIRRDTSKVVARPAMPKAGSGQTAGGYVASGEGSRIVDYAMSGNAPAMAAFFLALTDMTADELAAQGEHLHSRTTTETLRKTARALGLPCEGKGAAKGIESARLQLLAEWQDFAEGDSRAIAEDDDALAALGLL